MAKEIFISYSRKDFDKVKAIKDVLDREMGINCWMDLDGIESGDQFETKIIGAINSHRFFVFMLSPNSMASEYALDELAFAKEKGKRVILIYITPCQMTDAFAFKYRKYDTIDWNDSLQHDKLLNNLRVWINNETSQTSKNESYSVRFSTDETCELYIDGEKKRKLKGGHQSIVEGFETKKKYRISFHSLARTNSVIDVDYIQTSPTVPNQVFDLNISFVEQRQKEEKEEIAKRQAAKLEKEKEREREELVFQVLQGYDEFSYLYYGFYIVRKGRLYGYVDEMGFETIPCIYEKVSVFKNGHATVCKNGKWGIIDEYGQIVIDMQSDCPCWQFGNYQYFVFGNQGRYAITTLDAGVPTIFPYLEVALIEDHENYVWVRDENGWRLISLTGDSVPFRMTVNEIETRILWGYTEVWDADKEDEIKICRLPMRVQNIQSGRWGYLNSQLKLSIPFVNESWSGGVGIDNLGYIKTNNKMGVADVEKGVFIIPCKYDNIEQVHNSNYLEPFFCVADNLLGVVESFKGDLFEGGKQGIFDEQGRSIVPMIYQYIKYVVGEKSAWEVYQFACLLAPDMELWEDSGRMAFNLHNASIHVYDLEGRLVEKIPYLSGNNIYYEWGIPSNEMQKLAEEGHEDAQYDTAYSCYCMNDVEQAVKWLWRAAVRGHRASQFQLGEIYYYGKGCVKKDFDEAVKWFKLAAKQGQKKAIKYLQKHDIDY